MTDRKGTYNSKAAANLAKQQIIKKKESMFNMKNKNIRSGITPERGKQIALFNSYDLDNTIEDLNSSIEKINIFKGQGKRTKPAFIDDSHIGLPIMENFKKTNLFQQMLNIEELTTDVTKYQTGAEMMKSVVRLDNINYNYTTQKNMSGFKEMHSAGNKLANILGKGGHIIDFDIESVGGPNTYGHQQIDHITEIAASVYKRGADGSSKEVEKMYSLLGFDEKDYAKTKKYLESLKGKSAADLSGKDRVYLNRFSRIADPNIEINYSDGFEVTIGDTSKALSDKDLNVSVEKALEGLKVQRNIGIHQENFLTAQGHTSPNALNDYKNSYITNVQELVHNGKGLKNTYDPSNTITTGHNIHDFDNPQIARITGKQFADPKIQSFDTYQYTKYLEEIKGQGAHYKGIDPKKISSITKNHGTGTQDFLKAINDIGTGAGQAHNAYVDVLNHYQLVTNPNSKFGNDIKKNLADMNSAMRGLTDGPSNTSNNNGVFYMNSTAQQSWGNKNNALGFVYDPLDKSFKSYDGYRIGADGKTSKESINAYGPKANALYEHQVFEVKLNQENWRNQFKDLGLSMESMDEFYQEYQNLDTMYIMKSKEYMDPATLKKLGVNNPFEYEGGKTHIQLITDKNKIAGAAGVQVASIDKSGKLIAQNDTINALGFQKMEQTKDGIAMKNLNGQEALDSLLERSSYRTTLDSTARTVREGSYTRFSMQRNFAKNNDMKISQAIAKMVSQGQDLKMGITASMMDELGWSDFNGNRKIMPERLTKATVLDEYLGNMDGFFEAMDDVFADMGLTDLFENTKTGAGYNVSNKKAGNKETYEKMDYIFRQTLNNVLEDLGGDPSNNPNYLGSKSVVMSKDELNKIDFNKFDIFEGLKTKQTRGGLVNASTEFTSLDLNKNDALIRMFSKGKFDNIEVIPHSNTAFDALNTAYDTIAKDDRFKGVWGNLTKKDLAEYRHGNLSILQDEMTSRLKNFTTDQRKSNPAFGYKYARNMQDPTMPYKLLEGKGKNELKDLITKHKPNVDNFTYAKNYDSNSGIIDNIVDNYFMTFSKDDLTNQIQGLSERQQTALTSQYDLARKESTARATELLKSISDTDINLVMAGQGMDSKLILERGSDIRKLNMHKYTLTDGIIEYDIGGNKYSSNFAYNTSKISRRGRSQGYDKKLSDITITNNVQKTLDQASDLSNIVKYARDGDRDILDALSYNINSKRNGMLREASPRREAFNHANTIQRSMQVDFNGLIEILPELKDNGIIDKINDTAGIDVKYQKQFNEAIENMRDRKVRPTSIKELFGNESNLYFQLYDPFITEAVADYINYEGNDKIRELFRHVTGFTKDTNLIKGKKTLDDSPAAYGAARFDKARPTTYQYGGNEMYDLADIEKAIAAGKKGAGASVFENVSSTSMVTSKSTEKYLFNKSKNKTSGVTLKYLQASSNDLRNTIANTENLDQSLAKVANGLAGTEDVKKKLLNKAKGLSTYEQQSLMNSRVFDAAFHKTNVQTISRKKNLLLTHEKTLDMIEELGNSVDKLYPTIDPKTGKITYNKGLQVKSGQKLGMFGDSEEAITAKWDGIYRNRFYKDGTLVKDIELNSFIKKNGWTTQEDIIQGLHNNFDSKLEVVKKYQTYGAKVFNGTSEKSTVESLAMGIGSLDTDLAKFIGGKDKSLLNNVLTKEYEELILDKYGKQDVNGKTFANRYLNEKHAFSDFLSGLKGFEDVSQFMALDSVKHKSASLAIENGLNNLKNAGKLNETTLNALAGKGNWSIGDSGGVVFDDIKKLSYKTLSSVDSDAYKLFTDVEMLKNEKGNIIGHKGMSHVIQVKDDSAGTFAGRYTKEALENGTADSYKGVKFSKHMNTNLRRAIYNEDAIGLTRSRMEALGLSGEFKDTFSHVLNDNGKVSSEMKGKSILEPVVERMESLLQIGPGETLLSNTTNSNYDYLQRAFKGNTDTISLERAEKMYSYYQGVQANDFNNNTSAKKGLDHNKYKKLTQEIGEDYRFTEVDLTKARTGVADDWLSLDIGGQGDTVTSALNNPYTNNLMIRYGDKKNEVLAISRMPEKHFDDSIIKTEHISKLGQMQHMMQEMNSGNVSETRALELKGSIANTVDEIKDLQKKAMTSKYGLAGDMLETRLDQSFFGKASGIVYNDMNLSSLKDMNINSLEDVTKISGDASKMEVRKNALREGNHSVFSDAMFRGKSLIEHYAEGKAIDNIYVSQQAFKDMGYFDEDFMKNTLNNLDDNFKAQMADSKLNLNTDEDKMKHLLRTQGDSFVSVRYPEIMEGSDKVLMGYLNDELRGNQVQTVGHSAASMRQDHDGDQIGFARAKNKDGKSMLDYTTNTGGADDSLIRFADSIESVMMKRAVNENWHWDNQVREKLIREAGVARLSDLGAGQTMIDLVSDKMIDGELISGMIDTKKYNVAQYEGLRNTYAEELRLTAKAPKDADNIHDAAVAMIKNKGGSVDEYANAYAFQLYNEEEVAKSSKKSIGEINVTNQKINTAMASLMNKADEGASYKTAIAKDLFHIAEEAAISAKSSVDGLDPDRAKNWNEMAMKLITSHGSADEIEGYKKGMKDWANDYMIKDMKLEQYWNTGEYFQQRASETLGRKNNPIASTEEFRSLMKIPENESKLKKSVINDFVDSVYELRSVDNVKEIFDQLSIGQSTSGVKTGINQIITMDDAPTNYDQLAVSFSKMREIANAQDADMKNVHVYDKMKTDRLASNSIGEIIDASERNASTKSVGHAILEGAGNVLKGVGSSNIALGAIGIAGAVMMAGYVGGRPRPAGTQAMEEAQDYAPMDGYTPLVDPGLAFQQGTGQGYVVNINARTDKGRDHAVNAIQQALNSGTSSNINVSMNINDNYGNMNDRDLTRAIEDVFR